MTDPWAVAAQNTPAATPPATAGQGTPDGNLAGAYAPKLGAESQLFSGPSLPPSLMNKTHGLNTVRSGRIVKAPYDVQSRDFKTKLPKWWGTDKKPTTDPIDKVSGQQNRPVMDTVIELATQYRYDVAECAAIERDANAPDDGSRAFYASGDTLKQLRQEILRHKIGSGDEMVGMTLFVKRVGQRPNQGANPSWITEIMLER